MWPTGARGGAASSMEDVNFQMTPKNLKLQKEDFCLHRVSTEIVAQFSYTLVSLSVTD